jgi:hypothetical protein
MKSDRSKSHKIYQDSRCQHARCTFTCSCGHKVRRDIVTHGDKVQCESCREWYEFLMCRDGLRAFDLGNYLPEED